ncbi:hypothetical protein LTR56_014463 [Elasticomyces elasticus]|nr:hypothetical protein LTR56_014463 [Elasticomyces elasticus]KAK3646521.1 hypothetical protein LTR22_014284 [Elasticomyces elasticus]KAK4910452.1 hypothetical protein LTR49_020887 [Elasticomyces elasticus]KAK5755668.1 hypothetical protein LTS12_014229 [Elasticomyces elasticus]
MSSLQEGQHVTSTLDVLSALGFSATSEAFELDPVEAHNSDMNLARIEAAATAGDLEAVKDVFENAKTGSLGGTCTQTTKVSAGSALFLAVQHGWKDIVEYLLSEGMTVHATHIKVATNNRDTTVLELLFRHGWDINKPLHSGHPPALALAVEDPALVSWFLAHSADPNARCVMDITPLSAAVESASLPTIQQLFDHGASVLRGQLMHYAVVRRLSDRLQIMEYLLSKHPSLSLSKVMYEDEPYCFESKKYFGLGTPLHDAAASGHLDAVQFLLAHGSDASVKDSLGRLAIERARQYKHDSVVLCLELPA